MQRLNIKIIGKEMKRFGDTWRFRVQAESGNEQIKFEILCPNHELDQAKIDSINEQFRNSLRYCKHYAGFPDDTASEKDVVAAMDKLSSTAWGLGIRIKDDPLTEFTPFSL